MVEGSARINFVNTTFDTNADSALGTVHCNDSSARFVDAAHTSVSASGPDWFVSRDGRDAVYAEPELPVWDTNTMKIEQSRALQEADSRGDTFLMPDDPALLAIQEVRSAVLARALECISAKSGHRHSHCDQPVAW